MSEVLYVISSACNTAGNCVEAGVLPTGEVVVRDTKNRDVEPLVYTADEWDAFVAGVKAGEFDRTAMPAPVN